MRGGGEKVKAFFVIFAFILSFVCFCLSYAVPQEADILRYLLQSGFIACLCFLTFYAVYYFFVCFMSLLTRKVATFKKSTAETFSSFWRQQLIRLSFIFYVVMCVLAVVNEDQRGGLEGWALFELFLLFVWALWSIFLLAKQRKPATKLQKLYSVFSFLAVPLTGFYFIACRDAYEYWMFLNFTVLLFAPAAFFVTKIICRLHQAVLEYLEDDGNGTA